MDYSIRKQKVKKDSGGYKWNEQKQKWETEYITWDTEKNTWVDTTPEYIKQKEVKDMTKFNLNLEEEIDKVCSLISKIEPKKENGYINWDKEKKIWVDKVIPDEKLEDTEIVD